MNKGRSVSQMFNTTQVEMLQELLEHVGGVKGVGRDSDHYIRAIVKACKVVSDELHQILIEEVRRLSELGNPDDGS